MRTVSPASPTSSVSSGGQASEFEAERPQSLARVRIIGLRIGLGLLHAVEKQSALAGHIVAGGKTEYRLPALLDRGDRRDAACADHRGVHIGRGMQRIHGHVRSLE